MSGGDGHDIKYALCESVLPAVVIACTLEIIKAFGFFGWTDPLFARLVHAGSWKERSEVQTLRHDASRDANPRNLPVAPKLVVIDDDHFTAPPFNGASPLNREELAKLLKQFRDRRPKVLAIDLDVSEELTSNGTPPVDGVESVLHEITGACRGANAASSCCKTQIVLIEPFYTHSTGSLDTHANSANDNACLFVQRILNSGSKCIHFARSDIDEIGARAVFFNKAAPSLGVVAYALAGGKMDSLYEGPLVQREIAVCTPPGAEMKLRAAEKKTPGELINTRLIAAVAEERHLRPSSSSNSDGLVMSKANDREGLSSIDHERVVFFGGTWGDSDKHVTAARDNVDGVVVHAAVFDSLQVPKSQHQGWAFLLDIVIGIATGAAFFLTWGRYNGKIATFVAGDRAAPISVTTPGLASDRLVLSAYGAAAGWALGAWTVLAASILGAFVLAIGLLGWGTWMSPATMVIGMFVHALLSSRPEQGAIHHHSPWQSFLQGIAWAGKGWLGVIASAKTGLSWEVVQRLLLSLRWLGTLAIVVIGVAIVLAHVREH